MITLMSAHKSHKLNIKHNSKRTTKYERRNVLNKSINKPTSFCIYFPNNDNILNLINETENNLKNSYSYIYKHSR